VKEVLTHLSFQGNLLSNRETREIHENTPHLFGLDFSDTNGFYNSFDKTHLKIRDLDLTHVVWLNDSLLKEIIQTFPNIAHLSMGENPNIGPRGWGFLKQLPLKELDISFCPQIDDALFEIILQSIVQIKYLSLRGCKGITDKSFFKIALTLEELEEIDCRETLINEPELIELAYRCTKLKKVIIDRDQVSEGALANLKKNFSYIKIQLAS